MKWFLLSVLFISSGLLVCSQDIKPNNVPSIVKNTLMATFPDATDIDWKKTQNLFEADFDVAHTEYSALIDAAGKIVMVKKDVLLTELPTAVAATIRKDFNGFTVEDSEKIEKAGKVFFQIEMEKSNQKLKPVFSAEGQLLTNLSYWK